MCIVAMSLIQCQTNIIIFFINIRLMPTSAGSHGSLGGEARCRLCRGRPLPGVALDRRSHRRGPALLPRSPLPPRLLWIETSCASLCKGLGLPLLSPGPLSPSPALLHLPFHSPRRRHPLHPAACNPPLLRLPRLFRHLRILLLHLAEGATLRPLHTRPGVAAQDALGPRPTHGVHAFDS